MPKKIPTLVGFVMVAILIASISYGFNIFFEKKTQAQTSIRPKNLQITNLTDTGFTVTWTTDEPATGFVSLNESITPNTFYDERDYKGKMDKYVNHSVNINNLTPGKSYSYKILSNGKTYDKSGESYKTHTAIKISENITPVEPAYGSVLTPDGKPAEGAIVFLSLDGSQTVSTLVKPTGSWIIPLNQLRSKDTLKYIMLSERTTEYITISHPLDETTAITDTLNDSPVPMMIIGKSYDFKKQQAMIVPKKSLGQLKAATDVQTNDILGDQISKSKSYKTHSVSITQPADNSTLVSNLPLFKGTGIPDSKVVLTLGINNPVTNSIKTNEDGIWSYTPQKPLGSGKQSVTISTVNNYGKAVAITHVFDILKSGTQVLGDATPSATLTPEPTIEPTLQPTLEPTPTSTLSGTPPPTSGDAKPAAILIMASLILLLSGAFLHINYIK
ncbi:fibronectin type III domain-containing protein [Patescibacteria group bacterium]